MQPSAALPVSHNGSISSAGITPAWLGMIESAIVPIESVNSVLGISQSRSLTCPSFNIRGVVETQALKIWKPSCDRRPLCEANVNLIGLAR